MKGDQTNDAAQFATQAKTNAALKSANGDQDKTMAGIKSGDADNIQAVKALEAALKAREG